MAEGQGLLTAWKTSWNSWKTIICKMQVDCICIWGEECDFYVSCTQAYGEVQGLENYS